MLWTKKKTEQRILIFIWFNAWGNKEKAKELKRRVREGKKTHCDDMRF